MLVNLHIWEFPLTLILSAASILIIVLCGRKIRSSSAVAFIAGRRVSLGLLAITAALMAVEGTWGIEVHHSWPFLIVVLLLMLSLALTGIDGWMKKMPLSYILSHIGFAIILFGGFFGAPDVRDSQMIIVRDEASSQAFTADGRVMQLPFELQLADFNIGYYEDGVSPKQYTSTITADGKSLNVSVNHPARYKGWNLYQYDYDHSCDNGSEASYSVLKLVRDPWLPLVFLGMAIMAFAAVLSMKGVWRSKAVLPVVLGLAVVFGFISLARISFGTLVPALRSLWFIPHLIIYMIAYAVMALALVSSVVGLFGNTKAESLAHKLLSSASALMLIGMLCGAVWAKSAWGQYWTWDSKECWAAVTWLLTLVGTHLSPGYPSQKRRASSRTVLMIAILLAFLAMQITWYGVNWLPSSAASLHTYNL